MPDIDLVETWGERVANLVDKGLPAALIGIVMVFIILGILILAITITKVLVEKLPPWFVKTKLFQNTAASRAESRSAKIEAYSRAIEEIEAEKDAYGEAAFFKVKRKYQVKLEKVRTKDDAIRKRRTPAITNENVEDEKLIAAIISAVNMCLEQEIVESGAAIEPAPFIVKNIKRIR